MDDIGFFNDNHIHKEIVTLETITNSDKGGPIDECIRNRVDRQKEQAICRSSTTMGYWETISWAIGIEDLVNKPVDDRDILGD